MWQGNNTTAEDLPEVTGAADAAATPTPRTVTVLLLAPVWPDIRSQLKWGFLLHTYGFACLFFVLAFYAFFSILNLRSLISARPFMSSINGFLCLLGISRAGCLLIDPYNLKEAMPRVMGSVLWDVGFPCIASAFCLIQLAFLQLTQLKIGPERMRRKSCLSLVITAHFTCIIGADIAVGFQEHLTIAKYVMQTLFLCWAAFLSLVSLYGACRVLTLLKRVPGVGFQRDRSHKGIMQLALLAPYGNLAAALAPTLLSPPKIRVTDEHDHTVSVASTPQAATSDGCPPPTLMVRPPTPTLVGGGSSPGTSRRRCSDVAGNSNGSTSRRPSDAFSRTGASGSRRSSQVCHPSSRPVSPTPGCSRSNTFTASSSPRRSLGNANSRRGMSLGGANTGPHGDISEDETTAETSLLQHPASAAGSTRRNKNSRMLQMDPPPSPTPSATAAPSTSEGLTLHSILAHIAYRSSGAADAMCGGGMDGRGGGSALKGVVRATVCTALLLLLLAIGEAARAMGPYGAFAVRGKVEYSNREDVSLLTGSPRPWPWFCFQTACRALEFAIGCAMASITRQPARREQIPPRAYYSLRLESLYI